MAARDATDLPRIVCTDPYDNFAAWGRCSTRACGCGRVRSECRRVTSATIDPSAEIGPFAVIGANAAIGAGSIIGAGSYVGEGVAIGEGTRLFPHVTIYHQCVIGHRVRLHSGVVIGADGFGIAMDVDHWVKIPQIGRVSSAMPWRSARTRRWIAARRRHVIEEGVNWITDTGEHQRADWRTYGNRGMRRHRGSARVGRFAASAARRHRRPLLPGRITSRSPPHDHHALHRSAGGHIRAPIPSKRFGNGAGMRHNCGTCRVAQRLRELEVRAGCAKGAVLEQHEHTRDFKFLQHR